MKQSKSMFAQNVGLDESSFDQPFTFLQKHPIPSEELLTRSYYVIGFFILIDIILILFFVFKVYYTKKKFLSSETLLEADPNASISLGLYTSDT